MSYGITADLLKDVLPVATTTNPVTIRKDLYRVANRLEAALCEERHGHVGSSCPADWRELPPPEGPITIGLDGGFVRCWEGKQAQFEVIAGKSVPEDRAARFFGFVQTHDSRHIRRLHGVLRDQGLQTNQDLTILTDGGDTVRALVAGLPPHAEHFLDWFHVTMRLIVLGQFAKGLAHHDAADGVAIADRLQRIKWRLWHGDAPEALERIEDLAEDLRGLNHPYDGLRKFTRLTAEFATYIANNLDAILNYGERWRHGERISTAFANQRSTPSSTSGCRNVSRCNGARVVPIASSWSERGPSMGTLRPTFEAWYPGLADNDDIPARHGAA